MATSMTRTLAIGAVLFGGLLAGTTATRVLVQMPAWERLGVVPWAEFTRAENHGVGAFFFAVVGLMALLLTIATAIAFRYDRTLRGIRGLPIYTAVAIAVVVTRGMLVPEMFRVRDAAINVAELQSIFQRIGAWSSVNDILHVIGFGFNLWALTEILSSPQLQREEHRVKR